MVHVTRLSSFSSSSSFAFPVRASPITTRRCSPTVGRFTYKFNKHISYLMHALSRECFDRPGPPFFYPLFSSAFSPSRAFPRVNSSAHRSLPSTRLCASSWHRVPEIPEADPRAIVFSQLDHRHARKSSSLFTSYYMIILYNCCRVLPNATTNK